MSRTRVEVHGASDGGRPRLDVSTGRLRSGTALHPRIVHLGIGSCRVALVQDGALLLCGDSVRLEVFVGPGARLELVEPAGTVAYAMRGGSASWDVDVTVAPGGVLVWHGQPFVVAEGADVRRTMTARLEESASLLLRETLVLGRAHEGPGRLHARTLVEQASRPVLVEELHLGPGCPNVGVLGEHRVLDTVLVCGSRPSAPLPHVDGVHELRLAEEAAMWRGIGLASHEVSLAPTWEALVS